MKIILGIFIVGVMGVVALLIQLRNFQSEGSELIDVPPQKVFEKLVDLETVKLWYSVVDGRTGGTWSVSRDSTQAGLEFSDSTGKISGTVRLAEARPGELVKFQLHTTAMSLSSESVAEFRLAPEGSATRLRWKMTGDAGLRGNLIAFLGGRVSQESSDSVLSWLLILLMMEKNAKGELSVHPSSLLAIDSESIELGMAKLKVILESPAH